MTKKIIQKKTGRYSDEKGNEGILAELPEVEIIGDKREYLSNKWNKENPQSTSETPLRITEKGFKKEYKPGAGYLSAYDPLMALPVEGAILNPAFKLTGKGIKYGAKSLKNKILTTDNPISRINNKEQFKEAFQEYISPFGYQLFNTYDGKIPEVLRLMNGYVLKGNKSPKNPWYVKRMKIEPERTINRQEALRLYMGNPKPTDNLYIKNADGTYRYNPNRIPKENIEYQREVFKKAGNDKSSTEYLTTTLNGPKGTRPGNAGGLTSKIDDKGNFIIDDEWDLNPLKRINWLPEKLEILKLEN